MAQKQPDVSEWIEHADPDMVAVRVRCGPKDNPPSLVLVALEDQAEEASAAAKGELAVITAADRYAMSREIEAQLEAAGWGTEHPTARLHALKIGKGRKGEPVLRQAGSWQRSVRVKPNGITVDNSSETTAAAILADALRMQTQAIVSMMGQNTHALAVTSATLEHRETVLADAIEALVESRHAQVDTEAEALAQAVQSAINTQDGEELEAVKAEALGRGLSILEDLVTLKMGTAAALPDLESLTDEELLGIVEAHPTLIKRILTSPEIAKVAQRTLAPPETPAPPVDTTSSEKA